MTNVTQAFKDNIMEIGNTVEPINPRNVLHCGSGYYDDAVVVSVEPFVLVSRCTNMKWSATVAIEDFQVTGDAGDYLLNQCMRRMK